MPPVFAIESDERRRDTDDMPPPLNSRCLPPMLIVEKGESLDEFVERKAPDFFTALQVRAQHCTVLDAVGACSQPGSVGSRLWRCAGAV